MSKSKTAPYGSWESPITADMVASESLSVFGVTLSDRTTAWTEMRPAEDGRHAIVLRTEDGSLVEALREKGLPVAYILFEGEQHGFRRAETMERALQAELSFYAQVLGFEPADPIEPVKVEGL
jgi:hypothetical protein